MFEKQKYVVRMFEFSTVEKELTEYKTEIDTAIETMKLELETFKTVSENHCNFYGQVCRNFLKKTKELNSDLEEMISDLENRSKVIGDNVEKCRTLYSTFKDLYGKENS